MNNDEPTIQDVLEAINSFSAHIEGELIDIKTQVAHIEANMVTKSYLDDKLFDRKGELVERMQYEDEKLYQRVDGEFVRKPSVAL